MIEDGETGERQDVCSVWTGEEPRKRERQVQEQRVNLVKKKGRETSQEE